MERFRPAVTNSGDEKRLLACYRHAVAASGPVTGVEGMLLARFRDAVADSGGEVTTIILKTREGAGGSSTDRVKLLQTRVLQARPGTPNESPRNESPRNETSFKRDLLARFWHAAVDSRYERRPLDAREGL